MTSTPDPAVDPLHLLGWDADRAAEFAPWRAAGARPGRVVRPDRASALVLTATGPVRADLAVAGGPDAPADGGPTAGDWVAVTDAGDRPVVRAVLRRRTAVVRHAAGTATGRQVLVANVDVVFVVDGLDTQPNLRRLERLLTLVWESGATPAVLLTKADACPGDPDEARARVAAAAPGVAVHVLSAVTGAGLGDVVPYLLPGRTLALLGASGAGKSTLVNRLLGADRLVTGAPRADGKGRHTTTHRELVPLPGGAVLVDTPGLREVLLWDAATGLERTFADVEALAAGCRFGDCGHRVEPGCAVLDAVAAGRLDPARVDNYHRLQREIRHVARKRDAAQRAAERARWRAVARARRHGEPPRP